MHSAQELLNNVCIYINIKLPLPVREFLHSNSFDDDARETVCVCVVYYTYIYAHVTS